MTTKGDILIIDDDPDYCEMCRTVLEAHSYAVRCASTGREGLATMRRRKPDLVFLDVFLPDEDVYVSEEMAQDPDLRDVAIVMVSGIVRPYFAEHFPTDQTLQVRMFLDKTQRPETLVEVSDSIVAGDRGL